jgi:uncharacterized protein DUF4431
MMDSPVFSLPGLLIAHCALAADCLPYEPTTVTLEGTMSRRVFPGPPNFASVAEGDEKLVYWILRLKNPICVGSGVVANHVDEPERRVLEVQIAPKDDQFYKQNRKAVGRRVKITGTLFHQHTGWHVTKVVLRASDLSYAQSGAAGDAR